ncbi:MAG: HD domain-containing protein [Blautia sp.]|nr:HD domain-containing protein [Blautia sp.]
MVKEKTHKSACIAVFCLFGIALNVVGAKLVAVLGIPLYLDSIGTMTVAAMGGTIPGILVGFGTNVINGLIDPYSVYYSVLNVLIALCAVRFYRKGYFRKVTGVIRAILTFALIGGVLGFLISWLLYGFTFGGSTSEPLARYIYSKGVLGVFASQFTADLLTDLADKTVSVLILLVFLRVVPEPLKSRLMLQGWRQTPISDKKRESIERKTHTSMSLRSKILILLGIAITLIAIVVTAVSYLLFFNSMVEQQIRLGEGVANVVVSAVDPEKVDLYLSEGENAPDYLETEGRLLSIMESTPEIEYVYVYRILEDGCHVVLDPDTEDLPGEDPGAIIPFDEAFRDDLDDLLAGKTITPVISNETYGWLLTIYHPIYDKNGVCQCYAGVDISMQEIMGQGRMFLIKVITLYSGFFLVILMIGAWVAEYNLILPLNSMASVAGDFAYDTEKSRKDSNRKIREMNIRTGDEIENLYQSLVKTSEDTVRFIEDAEKQAEVISKLQNGLILVLADLVESRDVCTGNHVRNTAAYARITMEQMREDGYYLDQLTDEFLSDVTNSAPLHDVGKIHVPDAILNKPGKLTEEEFTIMKEHAVVGGEILEKAMEMVSEGESGYLKEAKNLAEYHHEKWNGSGYPKGLRGEEIPLSARIMAVADVYDALVSKRSYKEGFPVERAFAIIEEGKGTHFDPKIVMSFLKAKKKIREVTEGRQDV